MAWIDEEIARFHKWYGETAEYSELEPPPCEPDIYHHYGGINPAALLSVLPVFVIAIFALMRAAAE